MKKLKPYDIRTLKAVLKHLEKEYYDGYAHVHYYRAVKDMLNFARKTKKRKKNG